MAIASREIFFNVPQFIDTGQQILKERGDFIGSVVSYNNHKNTTQQDIIVFVQEIERRLGLNA